MRQWTLVGPMERVFKHLPEKQRLLVLWGAGIADTATVQKEVPAFAEAFRRVFRELEEESRSTWTKS